MAVAQMTEELLKTKINEEMLNCQICFESYTDPKSLPCLHTFCKCCLETYIRKQSSSRGNEILCPICRNESSLPAKGVDGLPTNFIFNSLFQILGKEAGKEKPKEDMCESCCTMGSDKPAVALCRDCDEMLCSDCVDAHSRVKMTRNHKLEDLNTPPPVDMDEKLQKPETMQKEWMCTKHISQKVTCVCLQCVLALCPFCISDILTQKSHVHKKHDIVGLEEAMTRFLSDMDQSLDSLRERITEVEDGIETLDDSENVMKESNNQVKSEVAARAKEIKSAVDRWKTKLDKDLDAALIKTNEEVSGRKMLLQSYLEKLNEGTKEINELINSGDTAVILRKDEFKKRIQILNMSTVIDATSFPQALKFSLDGVQPSDVKSKLPSVLGELKIEKVAKLQRFDSMSSLASGLGDGSEGPVAGKRIKKKNTPVSATVLTTYRIHDIVMVGMAVGRWTGDLFAVDSKQKEVYHFHLSDDNRFQLINKLGGKRLREPLDVDQFPDGRVVVSDGKEGHCVKIFQVGSGKMDAVIAHTVLKKACGVATSKNGDIVVTDVDAQCVLNFKCEGGDKFAQNWKIETHKDRKQFDSPQYIACGPQGEVIVTDRVKSQTKAYHANGRFKFNYGRFGTRVKQMRKPEGVCVDQDSHIYIADVDNKRIHVLSPRGDLIGCLNIPNICGKFDPTPSMVAVTKNGNLVLGNDQGWIKILKVNFSSGE